MSAPERERLVLELEGGGRPPAELPQAGVLVVGSSAERASFVVGGDGIAEVHCAIGRTKGGGWAIRDLGSPQGTELNGRRIESARLRHGDRIELGSRRLRVLDPSRADEPAPRADAPRADETQDLGDLRHLTAPPAATPSSSPAPSPRAEDPGGARTPPPPSIPGYRVEKLLGRGGMGLVWLAVQESLDRQVALKVLASRFESDAEFIRRFQAEARAAAALNHPNVVTVYDVGLDRGRHYLSMEYMDGGTLEGRVARSGPIAWREALDILRDAASGLVYAEARGIVHRDLKPDNLMQNHVGATKIADLGLATHVEAEASESADKKVYGTPHFMSPEQARGERIDSRSDLYSLGATAYRLLTGHTPFEGSSSRDILRALLRDEPRPMREFVPDLPEDVVQLVARLMRKEAAERFASAAEVLAEIERLRARAGASEPAKSSRAGLVLLLLALGAAGAWFALWRGEPKPDPRAVAGGSDEAPFEAPPAEPEPGPAGPVPAPAPVDDEQALQLFEAQARVALLELLGRDLLPKVRRDELRLLANKYRGTSSATEALAKADEIEASLQAAATAADERAAAVGALSERLRGSALLEADPPQPKRGLEALHALGAELGLSDDPVFADARREVERAITHKASTWARAVLDDTNRDLEAGRFDVAERKLDELLTNIELPEYPMGEGPAGVAELFELGRSARERRANLEALRDVFQARQAREDALRIAAAIGGAAEAGASSGTDAGLAREIERLDLAAARARIEALSARLAGPRAQAWARSVAAELEAAAELFPMLAREHAAGGWRRKTILDPRDKKNLPRAVVAVDAEGVAYEGDGGRVERAPWSAFGGDGKELSKLFVERLTREYDAAELAAIAALLRMTCVVDALDVVQKMFEPARRANFSEPNARELADCFAPAETWAAKSGTQASLARETEAAALLAQGLLRASDGSWSIAVASLERLLADHEDALLVRLLSDGRSAADLGVSPSKQ